MHHGLRIQDAALVAAVIAQEQRAALHEVGIEFRFRGLPVRDESLLIAFAGDFDDAECAEDVNRVELPELARADAAGVHEFEDRAVADPEWQGWLAPVGAGCGRGAVQEFAHARFGEHAGQAAPVVRSFEPLGVVFFDALL